MLKYVSLKNSRDTMTIMPLRWPTYRKPGKHVRTDLHPSEHYAHMINMIIQPYDEELKWMIGTLRK